MTQCHCTFMCVFCDLSLTHRVIKGGVRREDPYEGGAGGTPHHPPPCWTGRLTLSLSSTSCCCRCRRRCLIRALWSCCHGDVGQSADVRAQYGFGAGSGVQTARAGASNKLWAESRSPGFSRAEAGTSYCREGARRWERGEEGEEEQGGWLGLGNTSSHINLDCCNIIALQSLERNRNNKFSIFRLVWSGFGGAFKCNAKQFVSCYTIQSMVTLQCFFFFGCFSTHAWYNIKYDSMRLCVWDRYTG